jgi:rubrerythrin
MNMEDAIETAIRMETDAISFYREASKKTHHPAGKRMFESFIKDEERHLRYLGDILNGLDIEPRIESAGNVRTIFSDLKGQMMERISVTADEKEAIKLALDMEKKGYDYYKESVERIDDPKAKKLFEVLTAEEQRHYEILNNTYSFLEDTGNWFMWEEMSIVEGG